MDRRKLVWFFGLALACLTLVGAAVPMLTGDAVRVRAGGSTRLSAGGDIASGSTIEAFEDYVPVELSSFRAVAGAHPLDTTEPPVSQGTEPARYTEIASVADDTRTADAP